MYILGQVQERAPSTVWTGVSSNNQVKVMGIEIYCMIGLSLIHPTTVLVTHTLQTQSLIFHLQFKILWLYNIK